jgi:hypothetical protein
MGETKHYAKPMSLKLSKLCADKGFRKKINQLREKWGINKPVQSLDEANKFWLSICEADRKKPNYHKKWYEGETRDRRLKQDLEDLCKDADLAPDMWFVLYHILLCFDLDKVTEQDILQLPLHPSLARVSIVRGGFEHIQDNHLYLDVTFASTKDALEIWSQVRYWQENIRPAYIEEGVLPDLLKDIKNGRPYGINEELALEVARLKHDENRTWAEIGRKYDWPLQKDSYGNKNQCSTARYYAKRGVELRKRKGLPIPTKK